LTGIVTFQDFERTRFQPELDTLKSKLFGHDPQKNIIILHRREIVRREGAFGVLRNAKKLAHFNKEIIRLFSELPYLAITVQIDKKLHLEKYGVWHFDPYHYCLRCLVERYVNYLERWNWCGDVVIEARFKKSDKKLKASFSRIYETGTENLQHATCCCANAHKAPLPP
jgi:hypothetical protein